MILFNKKLTIERNPLSYKITKNGYYHMYTFNLSFGSNGFIFYFFAWVLKVEPIYVEEVEEISELEELAEMHLCMNDVNYFMEKYVRVYKDGMGYSKIKLHPDQVKLLEEYINNRYTKNK